jgi:hypothetical protein
MDRRWVACPPPCDRGGGSNVNAAAKECTGRDHYSLRAEATSLEGLDAGDASFGLIDGEPRDGALDRHEALVRLEQRAHSAAIEPAIALCARSPHSRALAPIEHAKLDHCQIGRSPHDAAKGVHLACNRALRNTADRGITRHLSDRLQRARDEADTGANARGCHGCLRSRMASADDEDVEIQFGTHERRIAHRNAECGMRSA